MKYNVSKYRKILVKQNQETEAAKMKREMIKGFNTCTKVFTNTEEEKTSKSSRQSTFAARSSSISKGLKYILKLLWRFLKSSPTLTFLALEPFKYVSLLVLKQSVVYLKGCLKCTLLRFSFSGSWDAMWENSLKMSRYVASPDEVKRQKH